MKPIQVTKRDGSKELLNIEKIQMQIARACEGISDVSPSMIELSAKIQFEDGMTTSNIDKLLLRAMIDLIDMETNPETGHVNYQHVAGKQRLRMLRKDVYGGYEPPRLYDIVTKNVKMGAYTPELLTWYTEDEWDEIEKIISHEKDEKYSFSAIEQLIEKYLVQNRVTKQIYETPQVRYIVAAATAFHMEDKSVRLGHIKDYYKCGSDGYFTLATPVLAGLGTPTKQFSSCVLLTAGDNLKSIFATGEMMANYAAKRAGIGIDAGRMRGIDAPIRGGEIKHTGIVPFFKKWFGDLRSCSQGGIRNASATMNFPIFHYQFDDFIVLKNNQGTEETRVRHLDYCVLMNAFFWKRFKEGGNITLFDPSEVPDLWDAFYSDTARFVQLYEAYEKRTDLRSKVFPASVVIKDWILKERTDTGRIYLMFVDNVMNQTPFDVSIDPIVQTNLCLTGDTILDVFVNDEEKRMRIDEIMALDTAVLVKSKHVDSNEVVYSSVTNAGLTGIARKLLLVVDEVSGKSIKCTPEHLIFTKNRGWVEAQNLTEDDTLDIALSNQDFLSIQSKLKITTIEEPEDVYDITVEHTHCFYANDILVHNCVEILLPTKSFDRIDDEKGRIALCTLGSINWGGCKRPEDMRTAVRTLVRALSNILGYQDFLSIQSKLSNDEYQPLGIGVTNLAYWHAKKGFKYGEPDALAEVKNWMEHQAFYLIEASADLAAERGACGKSHTTWYGKGVFPWERRAKGVNELADFTPNENLDWEGLRAKLKETGIKNATLMAIAPVESCQSLDNELLLPSGETKNLRSVIEDAGLDVDSIHQTGTKQWVNLPHNIFLAGRNGEEEINKVWYNGMADTVKITLEDGNTYEFTGNHRLLVMRDNQEIWVYVRDLTEGDDIVNHSTASLQITKIEPGRTQHTWDVSTPSETFLLSNGCVSHNSSVVINSTNGIAMPMALISTKESKAGSFVQVVPEYTRLKNKYQMMWEQTDCIEYLKTSAVLNAYCDQSISTDTFYSPRHFEGGKIPATLIAKNLMLFHKWGGKTVYYSLIEKLGAKQDDDEDAPLPEGIADDDDACEACVL